MNVKKVKNVLARYSDPTGIIFVPWANGDVLGNQGYDVFSIVGDTFSVTQDDPDTTEIPHEFSDTPLDENTSMGTATLTMQCLDFDDDILIKLFGCTKDQASGVVAFPAEYKDLYCLIQLEFDDKVVVFPKVKMNSKAVFENLRSDIARGELSGSLYNTDVVIGSNTYDTPRLHVPAGVSYSIGNVTITVKSGNTETSIDGGNTVAVTPTSLSFTSDADATGREITVDTTETVTATANANWITVSATDQTVTVTVAANTSSAERSGAVTITAGDTSAIVPVTQAGA